MLTILDEYYQNGLIYDHLKTKKLPDKLLCFSPGSEQLEPDSKYNDLDLIGTISAFNCRYLDHYLSDLNAVCQ